MELFNVLNEMEEFIEESPKVPMTRKVLVDEERLLDFVDRIRAVLPEEVRQARWLMQERDRVLAESKNEAMRLLESAQQQLTKRAEESEVVKRAEEMAEQVIERAKKISKEIKEGARDYADDILEKIESDLNKILLQIQQGRQELKEMSQQTDD